MPKSVRILLIVAFVLFDVALGAAAWMHVHREPASSGIDPVLTDAPTPASGAGAVPFELQSANVVMVDASARGTVITARRGACEGESPIVRVSLDGGRTLTEVKPDLSEVLAVRVDDDERGTLTVVGADARCDVVATRSTNGGQAWKDAEIDALDAWHAGSGDMAIVVTPQGPSRPGCKVSSLSAIDDTFARVSCLDGRVRGTGDAGKTWRTLGRLTNLRAAAFDDYTNGTALARHEGCAAYAFSTADGGRTWTPKGCAGGDAAQAITGDESRLVAVVDGQVAVSTNGGNTWRINEVVPPSPDPSASPATPSPSASPTSSPSPAR